MPKNMKPTNGVPFPVHPYKHLNKHNIMHGVNAPDMLEKHGGLAGEAYKISPTMKPFHVVEKSKLNPKFAKTKKGNGF